MDIQTILMYVLIALGLFFLVAPRDLIDSYTPDFISSLESSTLMLIGAGCLGGAYFLYYQSSSKYDAPPKYTPSESSDVMTPSV